MIQASDYANTTTETSPTIDISLSLPTVQKEEVEERLVTSVTSNPSMSAGQSIAFASQSSSQVMGSEVNSNMVSSSSISEVEVTSVQVTERPCMYFSKRYPPIFPSFEK